MASVFQSLFGGGVQAPDYSQGISAIQGATQRGVNALNTPQYNMIGSPYDQGLLSILSNYGQSGLNSFLQPSYNYGMGQIGQQVNQNSASAMSGAQGRGLGNSSIAQQGVNAAQYGGQQAQSSLLAALLGQQYGSQTQAAGQLAGQGSQVSSQQQATEQALASLYGQEGQSLAGIYGAQANAQTAAANQNSGMWGNFINALAHGAMDIYGINALSNMGSGGGGTYNLGQTGVPGYDPGVGFGGGPSSAGVFS